jgi:hypothetical protein
VASIVIGVLVIWTVWRLLRDTAHVVLDGDMTLHDAQTRRAPHAGARRPGSASPRHARLPRARRSPRDRLPRRSGRPDAGYSVTENSVAMPNT